MGHDASLQLALKMDSGGLWIVVKKCFTRKIEAKLRRSLTDNVFLAGIKDICVPNQGLYFCKVTWSSHWNVYKKQLSLICWLLGQILSISSARQPYRFHHGTCWQKSCCLKDEVGTLDGIIPRFPKNWLNGLSSRLPCNDPPVTLPLPCLQTYSGRFSQSADRPWHRQEHWAPIPACLYLLLNSSAPSCHQQPADGGSRAKLAQSTLN